MAKTYTEEQLNTFDKATLIQLLLMQQSQLHGADSYTNGGDTIIWKKRGQYP